MNATPEPAAPAKILAERGYHVWRGLLGPEEIAPVRREYAALLDELAGAWAAAGELDDPFAELDFDARLMAVGRATQGRVFEHLDISLPGARTTPSTPIHLGPAVFAMLTSRRLLDAVEAFIGPEILLHPVQHARIKPPEADVPLRLKTNSMVAQTSWHQDQSVVHEDADETSMLTVWIAVTDATIDNGCMQVVPFSHRTGLTLHCLKTRHRTGLHIPDERVPSGAVPVEMRAGDVLFMHRLTVHSSLANRSDAVRWSFDLRYSPVGAPTGREWAPSFVVRSKERPRNVVAGHEAWRDSWLACRERIAHKPPTTFRWDPDDIRCA